MSRTVVLGLGAAVVALIVLVALMFGLSDLAGPVPAARSFFRSIAGQGAQGAYATASPAFQQATPPQVWANTVQAHGLQDYVSSTWTRQGAGDVAELSGVVTLKSGATQPVDVRMVKGAKGWTLFSLNLPNGGVTGAQANGSTDAAPPVYGDGQSAAGQSAAGQAPAGASAGGYGDYSSGAAQPGLQTNGAAAGVQGGYPPSGAEGSAPYSANGYTAAPAGAPAAQAAPISGSRIARICGGFVLHRPGISTVDVHCPDGVSATPGSSTQCRITVNGHPSGMIATLRSYDPARDDAQFDCRPG